MESYSFGDRLLTLIYMLCADNLSNMMRKIGCLSKLSKEEGSAVWCVVLKNVVYIFESLLKALKYLDEHNLQHCDVKGRTNEWD